MALRLGFAEPRPRAIGLLTQTGVTWSLCLTFLLGSSFLIPTVRFYLDAGCHSVDSQISFVTERGSSVTEAPPIIIHQFYELSKTSEADFALVGSVAAGMAFISARRSLPHRVRLESSIPGYETDSPELELNTGLNTCENCEIDKMAQSCNTLVESTRDCGFSSLCASPWNRAFLLRR